MSDGVRKLEESMKELEEQIAAEVEKLKSLYEKAASSIPPDKSYYLIGVQTGSVVKGYLLTSLGVGVQGEGVVPIGEFIDSAIRFANYPKRKIEVLRSLVGHLDKIRVMTGFQETN